MTSDWGFFNTMLDWYISNRSSPSVQRVNLLIALKLLWNVLGKELVNWEPSTTNLNKKLGSFYFDHHPTSTELIDALRHSQEHNLELSAVLVAIDELGDRLVHAVSLYRHIR